MRVGIHCLAIYPAYHGGTNSFTFGLLDAFAGLETTHEFSILCEPWNMHVFERYAASPHVELVVARTDKGRLWAHRIHRRLPERVRQRVTLPPRSVVPADAVTRRLDVLYVPYVPPATHFPFPDVPTVYSIHDIQHVHYPEFFTAEELATREAIFADSVAHAAVIQASSCAMRDEFCAHFPTLNESNVAVIPEGVDVDRFSRPANGDVAERYGLPSAFLFTPAQLWHHKNHLTILRALRRLKDSGLVLPWVLTGADYNAASGIFEFIAENGLEAQVFYLGIVPFEDVVALHQGARLLVTASLYESSSLTILEAAAAGTPIVAGRIPPHEEMAEHLEMRLFPPRDDAELARILAEAWDDDATNEAQAAANRVSVRRYSWENAARMYIQLFERIGDKQP